MTQKLDLDKNYTDSIFASLRRLTSMSDSIQDCSLEERIHLGKAMQIRARKLVRCIDEAVAAWKHLLEEING